LEGFYPAGWDFEKIDACIDAPGNITVRQPHWNEGFNLVQCDALGELTVPKDQRNFATKENLPTYPGKIAALKAEGAKLVLMPVLIPSAQSNGSN